MSLFHDGEVSAEVSVKYFIKSKTAESGDHFAGDDFAGGKSQCFAESHAH